MRGDLAAPLAAVSTERKLEIVVSVARGLTNAEVAAILHIGEATVKTHVSHALRKLGLRDRTQLVIWAYEAGVQDP